MIWAPQEIFITPAARQSQHQVCLYKDRHSYIIVDYMEVDEYLEKNYKRTPMDCEEELTEEGISLDDAFVLDNKDLKVKIDRLEAKIKEKESEYEDLLIDEKRRKKR